MHPVPEYWYRPNFQFWIECDDFWNKSKWFWCHLHKKRTTFLSSCFSASAPGSAVAMFLKSALILWPCFADDLFVQNINFELNHSFEDKSNHEIETETDQNSCIWILDKKAVMLLRLCGALFYADLSAILLVRFVTSCGINGNLRFSPKTKSTFRTKIV